MSFLSYLGLIFALVIFVLNVWLISLFFIWLLKKNKAAPYVGTFDKEIRLMRENLHLIKWKKLADLGCGDGKALRFFVKNFGIKWIWYDINIFAILLGRIVNYFLGFGKNIKLIKSDFMKIDLSTFDYVYVYLLPVQLAFIEDWLWKNIDKNSIIISNSFQFKNHTPFEVIKDKKGKWCIFLYKKEKN